MVSPRSMQTSDVFSILTLPGDGWSSIFDGVNSDTGLKEGGLSAGYVTSLMALLVVQGYHRGEAGAEEESLPPNRLSRKSSALLSPGLGL